MTLRWNLTGTEAQKTIARAAFERIKFPFDRLSKLPGTPELGWRDLNGGLAARASTDAPRAHEGHHPTGEDRADPLVGTDESGRRYTYGVIYTLSGRIYIDVGLEAFPEVAMTTIAAEAAHAVDFFLPMTDVQRNEFLRLWGVGGTWWEVADYSDEYFRLGGEAFMREFVEAYAPSLDFASISGFLHDSGVGPEDVYRVLGIRRTDYVAPLAFVAFGKSTIFHKATHYPKKTGARLILAGEVGYRPCKVCKP